MTCFAPRSSSAARVVLVMRSFTGTLYSGKTFSAHQAVTEPVDMSHPHPQGFIGDYNQTTAYGGVFLSAFSDGTGKMGVARIVFEDTPPTKRRRSLRP